jgi:hypothetical protein
VASDEWRVRKRINTQAAESTEDTEKKDMDLKMHGCNGKATTGLRKPSVVLP